MVTEVDHKTQQKVARKLYDLLRGDRERPEFYGFDGKFSSHASTLGWEQSFGDILVNVWATPFYEGSDDIPMIIEIYGENDSITRFAGEVPLDQKRFMLNFNTNPKRAERMYMKRIKDKLIAASEIAKLKKV